MFGAIYQIENFDRVSKEVENLTKDDLIVFDIDYVLLIPNDMILRPCGIEKRKHFFESLGSDKFFYTKMLVDGDENLVDSDIIRLIQCIKGRSSKIIALTSRETGLFSGQYLEDLRIKSLKQSNIDFSDSFPEMDFLVLDQLSDHKTPLVPLFKQGCLFSNKCTKGETLRVFLEEIGWMPKRVIFIDDQLKWLESAQREMNALNVEFTGFHYLGAYSLTNDLDEDVANFQMNHLKKTEEWLSDEQVRSLLKDH